MFALCLGLGVSDPDHKELGFGFRWLVGDVYACARASKIGTLHVAWFSRRPNGSLIGDAGGLTCE